MLSVISTPPSLCLLNNVSIYSIYLSIYLSIYIIMYPSIYLYCYLSLIHLSLFTLCLSIYLVLKSCLSISFIYLHICLSIYLFYLYLSILLSIIIAHKRAYNLIGWKDRKLQTILIYKSKRYDLNRKSIYSALIWYQIHMYCWNKFH